MLEDEHEIRMSALGSILHLIQDSYSKSHTNRGGSETHPEVVCNEVEKFWSYRDQDAALHGESDKWPSFDSSCQTTNSDKTLDPITAAAQLIWLHANSTDTSMTVNDLINSVYGEIPEGVPSSSGEQYSH